MLKQYNKNLKIPARQLRKEMTDAETILWDRLRVRQLGGIQFYRQKPLGNYIVDFYAPEAKIVVEIDGPQHCTTAGLDSDGSRDEYLKTLGLKVIRFTNSNIMAHIDLVVQSIMETVVSRITPFVKGGRGDLP